MLFVLVVWLHVWQQATPQAALPTPAAPLTVMSFNIRLGAPTTARTIGRSGVSSCSRCCVGSGPTWSGCRKRCTSSSRRSCAPFPATTGSVSDGPTADGPVEYSAILYRTARLTPRRSDTFWFSDTPTVPGSMSWGNRYERICTWAYFEDREGPAFYAYNVHLDHESQPSRERSADLLMRTVNARNPRAPVVVTGDFNSGENNAAAKTVAQTLRDTFRLLHPDATEVGTFNGFTFGKTTGEKIDYVFVEPGTEVLGASIVRNVLAGRYPSDHFPVTATVRFSR